MHTLPVRLTPNLAVSESGFLFLTTTGETFAANECARLILRALQQGWSEAEVVAALLDEYDADPRAVERDLQDFVAQLRHYHLLADADPA